MEEIVNAIKGIKIDTAPGPDHLLLRSLKHPKVIDILLLIYNFIIKNQYVPASFKIFRTILIDKGGNSNDVNNWRPISLCSIIRRVYEKILDKRLKTFITFCEQQQGFTHSPGTYINSSIVDGILRSASKKKIDCGIMFLDVTKAYDNISHIHIEKTLFSLPIPLSLCESILNLLKDNTTQIETIKGKTQKIFLNKGVPQGSPLSPTLFNLAIDFILEDLADVNEQFGYKLTDFLPPVSVLGFADDTVLVSRDKKSLEILYYMAVDLFKTIGLSLNISKTKIIYITDGILSRQSFSFENYVLYSIDNTEKIKYLGINFSGTITFDHFATISKLKTYIEKLVASPFLKDDKKINILNIYIWPIMIYPFQTAPLNKLSREFLNDIDIIFRSAIKEILDLPSDIPNHMIYSAKNCNGLGLIKANWEAYIQHFKICDVLEKCQNAYVLATRNLKHEMGQCLLKLNILTPVEDITSTKQIRLKLRDDEFEKWTKLPSKGKGVILFSHFSPANISFHRRIGLTSSEYKDGLKMIGAVAPVRVLPGRSRDGTRCRHCSTTENYVAETLPHVLGSCPFGEKLRNTRHNSIRNFVAESLEAKGYVVFQEVTGIANNGGTRRIDIIAIDRKKDIGFIIDPTVRFEIDEEQPVSVDREKKAIYEPTVDYYKAMYKLKSIEVIGLCIGARGAIPSFILQFGKRFKLDFKFFKFLSLTSLKLSILILRNHLYNNY